jgi:hypothetical protein
VVGREVLRVEAVAPPEVLVVAEPVDRGVIARALVAHPVLALVPDRAEDPRVAARAAARRVVLLERLPDLDPEELLEVFEVGVDPIDVPDSRGEYQPFVEGDRLLDVPVPVLHARKAPTRIACLLLGGGSKPVAASRGAT